MTDIQANGYLLIVEDDPLQLLQLEETLIEAGFEVLTASSGVEAVAVITSHAAEIKGIITDIKLGNGPDGWAVGKSARESIAAMPIVYVSGDSSHEWVSRGVPNSLMLSKPFASAQIVTAVSHLINLTAPSS